MFANMPRQMFGRVQAKMFPKYFSLTTAALLILLAGHWLYSPAGLSAAAPGVTPLLWAVGLNVVNLLFIEPYVTKMMFERYDLENKGSKTAEDEVRLGPVGWGAGWGGVECGGGWIGSTAYTACCSMIPHTQTLAHLTTATATTTTATPHDAPRLRSRACTRSLVPGTVCPPSTTWECWPPPWRTAG